MHVFYTDEMSAANADSYSPSASKPRRVVELWQQRQLPIEVVAFEPIKKSSLGRVHSPTYVAAVLMGDLPNGFGNHDPEVAESLRWTNGSMLAAAEYATRHNAVVCSPTSGFHHAGYSRGGGFCTFNGLMATACELRRVGAVKTVGILDCDAHYGDGTDDIINRLNIDWIKHRTFGGGCVGGGEAFRRWLLKAVDAMQHCDLILYQAGADPHVDDPLGGMLTTEEMRWRDRTVAQAFAKRAMVWNLAGGYQKPVTQPDGSVIDPVLELHTNTLMEMVEANR